MPVCELAGLILEFRAHVILMDNNLDNIHLTEMY